MRQGQPLHGCAAMACCAALSVQSLSVFLQVRALLCRSCPSGRWPWPARFIWGFPCCFSGCLFAGFPGAAEAISTLGAPGHLPHPNCTGAALVLFAFCCLVLFRLEQAAGQLRRSKQA